MPGYSPPPDVYDEAFARDGDPRAHYRELIGALAEGDLERLAEEVGERLARHGVTFGASDDGLLAVDPVPRLLTAGEWRTVARGISQRARALDAFATDAYGPREIVAAGLMPARVIDGSEHYEPAMRDADPPPAWVSLAGFDLVRAPDGRFRVLEDQVRMPSGIAYVIAARELLEGLVDVSMAPVPLGEPFAALGDALRDAAPGSAGDPVVALLSDGPAAAGWYEHVRVAEALGLRLVTLADLERRGDEVVRREGDRRERVDVVYLRTDVDRFTAAGGELTAIGELLLEPCRAGTVWCVNAPGSGIVDDKLVHAYSEEMIRFYLGEDPVLESVRTLDVGRDADRTEVRASPDELVFKPRGKMGGEGVVVWRDAGDEVRGEITRALDEAPERMVAQRLVELSTHPTVRSGRLAPRRVDLRPYLIRAGEGDWALPGGLSRVALERGSMIVNSGQGGGVKDTWVLPG